MTLAGTVSGSKPYSRDLGRNLAENLARSLGKEPNVCWLFCAPGENMEKLLEGIFDVFPNSDLLGCTTDGEIYDAGITMDSAVLGGIVSNSLDFHIVCTENISKDSFDAGRRLASDLPFGTRYIHLFSDGITGNGSAILEGLKSVLGRDLIVSGGTAGDNGKFRRTWQFAGNRVLSDAAVAIAFNGNFSVGTGIRSGWVSIGLPKKVTRSKENILYELNGEPALEVYERFLGRHAAKLPSIGVEYPLGLIGKEGDVGKPGYFLLRATMFVDREEKSIHFAGDIPEGSLVNLTCGDISSVLKASREAANEAFSQLSGKRPVILFCYSCMARKITLGRRIKKEFENIRSVAGDTIPIVGFYTYGEYCPVLERGESYFHNETITLSLLGVDDE